MSCPLSATLSAMFSALVGRLLSSVSVKSVALPGTFPLSGLWLGSPLLGRKPPPALGQGVTLFVVVFIVRHPPLVPRGPVVPDASFPGVNTFGDTDAPR